MSNDNVVPLRWNPLGMHRKSVEQRKLHREAIELCIELFKKHADDGTVAPAWLHEFANDLREQQREFSHASRD